VKKRFVLEKINTIGFDVLAINSHAKGYKLCWNINKELKLDFEKTNDQIINKNNSFSRYKCVNDLGVEYNILANRSKTGYLLPDKKSVNYFFIINQEHANKEKEQIIKKLKQNREILMVFEIDIKESKYINRLIFNDKKN
tara:strand:+ start:1627 stop:2046 length:420 start_codon:yes stop_codon:yes gene_type:complete